MAGGNRFGFLVETSGKLIRRFATLLYGRFVAIFGVELNSFKGDFENGRSTDTFRDF